MRNIKIAILCGAAALGFTAHTATAQAQEWVYTPYHDVYYAGDYSHMSAEQRGEFIAYMEYEEREPCQNYREPPAGLYRDGCDLYIREAARVAAPATVRTETTTQTVAVSNVLANYEILFGFDSSVIEPAAHQTLDRIAGEITRYNPREVTVAGHADKSGASDYNIALSERRAQAVSKVLTERGVANRVITQEAYGEAQPAVATPDGVKLRENRRVVVEFLK